MMIALDFHDPFILGDELLDEAVGLVFLDETRDFVEESARPSTRISIASQTDLPAEIIQRHRRISG
jgi:hypothetical protein